MRIDVEPDRFRPYSIVIETSHEHESLMRLLDPTNMDWSDDDSEYHDQLMDRIRNR